MSSDLSDEPIQAAIKLAGLTLAHSAWSISDGSTLCTLAFTQSGTDRALYRFEADAIDESLEGARAEMAKLEPSIDSWVIAFDGYFNSGDRRVDSLILQPWGRGLQLPERIVQNYQPKSWLRRFKLLGTPLFVGSSTVPTDEEKLQQWLLSGVMEHEAVAELWPKWVKAP